MLEYLRKVDPNLYQLRKNMYSQFDVQKIPIEDLNLFTGEASSLEQRD